MKVVEWQGIDGKWNALSISHKEGKVFTVADVKNLCPSAKGVWTIPLGTWSIGYGDNMVIAIRDENGKVHKPK